jgi:putative phage-type endonuclease
MIRQNTPEWKELRKTKIGASDAAPILGISPYKTAYRLWQEKLGLVQENFPNYAMQRGVQLEEEARLQLESITGLFFLPVVRFHDSIEWMIASLDGIDAEGKFIAEIKCPNRKDHIMAQEGKIPDKYYPQLQHQLEVCQLDVNYYFSFDGKEGALVKVFRDDVFIQKMLQRENEFWECLQEFRAP